MAWRRPLNLDYLVIGHITRDLTASSARRPRVEFRAVPPRVGGTAAYVARTARALGRRVGVVTSAPPELELQEELGDVKIAIRASRVSTTFVNIYDGGRHQAVRSVAPTIGPAFVPADWHTSLVHVAPVARECDPSLVTGFPGAFVGVTPQGWMRQWNEAGRVSRRDWSEAEMILPHADAVVLSEEDVAGDRSLAEDYARRTSCLVLTEGAAGCTVYSAGDAYQIPAPKAIQVDPTGAGDVFAACFFDALQQTRDPRKAARFANCCAAWSVERTGLSGTPLPAEVARCWGLITGAGNHGHSLRAG